MCHAHFLLRGTRAWHVPFALARGTRRDSRADVGRVTEVRGAVPLTLAYVVPVDPFEPGVALEVLQAVLTQPAVRAADEPPHQVLGILRHRAARVVREVEAVLPTLTPSHT